MGAVRAAAYTLLADPAAPSEHAAEAAALFTAAGDDPAEMLQLVALGALDVPARRAAAAALAAGAGALTAGAGAAMAAAERLGAAYPGSGYAAALQAVQAVRCWVTTGLRRCQSLLAFVLLLVPC